MNDADDIGMEAPSTSNSLICLVEQVCPTIAFQS